MFATDSVSWCLFLVTLQLIQTGRFIQYKLRPSEGGHLSLFVYFSHQLLGHLLVTQNKPINRTLCVKRARVSLVIVTFDVCGVTCDKNAHKYFPRKEPD